MRLNLKNRDVPVANVVGSLKVRFPQVSEDCSGRSCLPPWPVKCVKYPLVIIDIRDLAFLVRKALARKKYRANASTPRTHWSRAGKLPRAAVSVMKLPLSRTLIVRTDQLQRMNRGSGPCAEAPSPKPIGPNTHPSAETTGYTTFRHASGGGTNASGCARRPETKKVSCTFSATTARNAGGIPKTLAKPSLHRIPKRSGGLGLQP